MSKGMFRLIAITLVVIAAAVILALIFAMKRGLMGQYQVLQVTDAGLVVDTPGGPRLIPSEDTRCELGETYPRCGIRSSVYGGESWNSPTGD